MTKSPIDLPIGEHALILGKTRSGKSNTVKGWVEDRLGAHERVCIIDPTDVWWGLRLERDGKHASRFPIVIFGGDHADLPLHATAGSAVAEAVARTSSPVVICTALMDTGERTRFFTEFAATVLRLNRGPLRLVIDETHLFIPQGRVQDPQSAKMMGAGTNLVALGGGRGISVVMITQRPQKLHKDVTTAAEVLIAMRLPAPQDRAAVKDWIDEWGDRKEAEALLASLPSLNTGEGWIYSGLRQQLQRVKFPALSTYDSGKWRGDDAPKLSPIDIADIKGRLEAAQVETELDGGVKALRARIKELENANLGPKIDAAGIKAGAQAFGLQMGAQFMSDVVRNYLRDNNITLPKLDEAISEFLAEAAAGKIDAGEGPEPRAESEAPVRTARMVERIKRGAEQMGPAERKMLAAIVQFPGSSLKKVAMVAGYSHTSGGVAGAIGLLRRRGFVEAGVPYMPTTAGVEALGEFDPLPVGRDLVNYWLEKLDMAPRNILVEVLKHGANGIKQADAARNCGYSPTSGGVAGALADLRNLGLIEGRGGAPLTASPHLMGR